MQKIFKEIEKLSEEGRLFPPTINNIEKTSEIIPFTRVMHATVGLTLLKKLEHARNLITRRMFLFCAIFKGHRPGFVQISLFFLCSDNRVRNDCKMSQQREMKSSFFLVLFLVKEK